MFTAESGLNANTMPSGVPTTQVSRAQALAESSEPILIDSSSEDEVAPTPTKRGRNAPVLQGAHKIDENFNNYGNLSAKEILFGKDAGGKFRVPSHHIFGGIFLKVFRTYSHAEILEAVNQKLVAEGFTPIQRKSCERRLSAAIVGKATAEAEAAGQVPDILKALVDHDVSMGKDRAKALQQRSQKMKDKKKSAYGTYGKPCAPVQSKRKPSQTAGNELGQEEEDAIMPPKKTPRKSRRSQTQATPDNTQVTNERSGELVPQYDSFLDIFNTTPMAVEEGSQQQQVSNSEMFGFDLGFDPLANFANPTLPQEPAHASGEDATDLSWLNDLSNYSFPEEQIPPLDNESMSNPNSTHWRGKPPAYLTKRKPDTGRK